ncbi:MAG: GspH/FimT family pseudopilin [Gammaproteobacteria bacterium]|nr:GspH/FimT family pseudopilin [Gammaproteobacteria bacterium]
MRAMANRRIRGFTLFELMLTLGLAAVLMGLAAPSVTNFMRSSRLSGASRDLLTDLTLARSEAVMRATRVTVCTSNNMTSCTNDGWAQGRLVFVDGGAIRTIDGADLVLVRTNAPPVTASGAGVALVNAVSFQANGRLNGVGRINVCADGQRQRRIDLTRAGLATLNRTNIAC